MKLLARTCKLERDRLTGALTEPIQKRSNSNSTPLNDREQDKTCCKEQRDYTAAMMIRISTCAQSDR